MKCLVAVVIVTMVLSLLSGWCCAQVPGDEDPHCTETLPSIGVNILDYPPEVKPLMDSRNYQQLLPPVWQQVDNDNNNPGSTTTNVSCCTGHICIHFVSATYLMLRTGFVDCCVLGLPWSQSQAFPLYSM